MAEQSRERKRSWAHLVVNVKSRCFCTNEVHQFLVLRDEIERGAQIGWNHRCKRCGAEINITISKPEEKREE